MPELPSSLFRGQNAEGRKFNLRLITNYLENVG